MGSYDRVPAIFSFSSGLASWLAGLAGRGQEEGGRTAGGKRDGTELARNP